MLLLQTAELREYEAGRGGIEMDRREFMTGLSVAASVAALCPALPASSASHYEPLYSRWLFEPGEGLKWMIRHLGTGMTFECRGVKDNHFYDVVTVETGDAPERYQQALYWAAYQTGVAAKYLHKFRNHQGAIYYEFTRDHETLTREVV